MRKGNSVSQVYSVFVISYLLILCVHEFVSYPTASPKTTATHFRFLKSEQQMQMHFVLWGWFLCVCVCVICEAKTKK